MSAMPRFPVSFATFSVVRGMSLFSSWRMVSSPRRKSLPQPLWTKRCSEIYASLTCSCMTNI